MKVKLYSGLYAGKHVQMSITDMSKEFKRSLDFINRHKKIAEEHSK